MNERQTAGHWLSADGWLSGICRHQQNVNSLQRDDSVNEAPYFIPAPIDLHVHGGGGCDVMQGDAAIHQVLQTHAAHGTGALLATSVTAPFEAIDDFLASTARVMKDLGQRRRSFDADKADHDTSVPLQAELLGVHLEGPFINPDKLGAQPDYPAALDLARLERWFDTGLVRVITYAPELDPDNQVPVLCRRHGVRAQIGHTLCSWATAAAALNAGVGVTHLYNAMSPVQHREGGAAVAALAYATHAEIITDGIHVDRAAFDAARRAIDGLYSITDATAAAGMPDGEYQLGSLTIEKIGHRVLLPDGTLAGSCLTQQRSLQVLRDWGLNWRQIARLTSGAAANWLGIEAQASIAPGAPARWLEIVDDRIVAIWLDGIRHPLETRS